MFGPRLRELRRTHQMTQTELARRLQLSQQSVNKWETGRSFPNHPMLLRLASLFQVSLDYLLGQENKESESHPTRLIPVIGWVKAGYDSLAQEEYLGEISTEVKGSYDYFYLLIRGDSMAPRIQEGDLALVRCQESLQNGDLGVLIYGDEAGTLKRYRRQEDSVWLEPFNPDYPVLKLSGEELNQLRIVGKVIETKAHW